MGFTSRSDWSLSSQQHWTNPFRKSIDGENEWGLGLICYQQWILAIALTTISRSCLMLRTSVGTSLWKQESQSQPLIETKPKQKEEKNRRNGTWLELDSGSDLTRATSKLISPTLLWSQVVLWYTLIWSCRYSAIKTDFLYHWVIRKGKS